MSLLEERVLATLGGIRNPRTNIDLLSARQVGDFVFGDDGRVRMTLLLGPDDDARLVRDVRHAIEGIDGVAEVRIDVRDPRQRPIAPRTNHTAEHMHHPQHSHSSQHQGRQLPVVDNRPVRKKSPSVPEPVAYPGLGRIIAVSSGKGGVGKSTVAVNIAIALAKSGKRVGIMDADIYGPNLPLMLGVDAAPAVRDEKIIPLEAHGLKVISLGFLIEKEQPAIWRGPIVMKIITQFLKDVDWGELDYLLVDMPPGTGDAQLSLVQATQVHGAVIVTTPQQVAVGDALRGVKMFERTAVPVLGIVENMSPYEDPETGRVVAIFGSGGGERLASECGLPLLGQVPLDPRIQQGGDSGRPILVDDPDGRAALELQRIAERVAQALQR